MNKIEYKTLGNIGFDVVQIRKLSLKEFKLAYAGKLRGYDINQAAKELGIKSYKPKKTEEKEK